MHSSQCPNRMTKAKAWQTAAKSTALEQPSNLFKVSKAAAHSEKRASGVEGVYHTGFDEGQASG